MGLMHLKCTSPGTSRPSVSDPIFAPVRPDYGRFVAGNVLVRHAGTNEDASTPRKVARHRNTNRMPIDLAGAECGMNPWVDYSRRKCPKDVADS